MCSQFFPLIVEKRLKFKDLKSVCFKFVPHSTFESQPSSKSGTDRQTDRQTKKTDRKTDNPNPLEHVLRVTRTLIIFLSEAAITASTSLQCSISWKLLVCSISWKLLDIVEVAGVLYIVEVAGVLYIMEVTEVCH